MPAYLVAHVKFRSTSWLKSEYATVTAELEAKHGAAHVASGPHEQVEGDEAGTVTSIIEFPTIEAARAYWNEPEYQRVAELRRAGSDCQVF
jgi:uncharacterized protein (DUF1330 family)